MLFASIVGGLAMPLAGKNKSLGLHHSMGAVFEDIKNSINIPYGMSVVDVDQLDEVLMKINKGNNPLKEAMKTASDKIGQAILGEVRTVRNVVIPANAEYTAAVKKSVQSWLKFNGNDEFTITEVSIPEVLVSGTESLDLEVYREESTLPINTANSIAGFYEVGIMEILTEFYGGNQAVLEYLGLLGADKVDTVANRVFGGAYTRASDLEAGHIEYRINESIITLLLSTALRETVPEYLDITLGELSSYCINKSKSYGARLVSDIDSLNKMITNKRMVIRENKRTKTLVVVAPLFKKWLKKVGTIEAVYGRILSKDNGLGVKSFTKGLMEYSAVWANYSDRALAVKQLQRNIITRKHLLTNIEEGIGETDLEKDYTANVNKNFHKTALALAEVAINNLHDNELSDIELACTKVITQSRFGFTNAHQFLMTMEAMRAASPNAPSEVLATLAVIEGVTDFLRTAVVEVG